MQSRNRKKIEWGKFTVYIVLVVVFIFFSVFLNSKGFMGTNNLLNILRQTAMVSVMAVAGVFVLGAGQIDLTVGSNAAMSALIAALVLQCTNSILLAVLASIAFGLGVGFVNACHTAEASGFPCDTWDDAGCPRGCHVDYRYGRSAYKKSDV